MCRVVRGTEAEAARTRGAERQAAAARSKPWAKGDAVPLGFLQAMQTAASAAATALESQLLAAVEKHAATAMALKENTFDPEYAKLYETRLVHENALALREKAAVERAIKDTIKRSHAIDLEAVRAIAETSKAAMVWYSAKMEAMVEADPAAFDRIAAIASAVNVRCGTLPIGAECLLLRKGGVAAPVKVRVESEPDRATGAIQVKEWVEENRVTSAYYAGYRKASRAGRGELSGGLAPLKQTLPDGAVTAPEQFSALNAMALASLPPCNAVFEAIVSQVNARHGAAVVSLVPGGVKPVASASRKCFNDYGGVFAYVLDMLRFTIQCEAPAHVADVLEAVEAEQRITILRFKNRLELRAESAEGYRDTLANIEHDGFILELQVTLASMQAKKAEAHDAYQVDRGCSLPKKHLGAATSEAAERLAAGVIRNFDISGTVATPAALARLSRGLRQPAIRLSELKMNACPGMKGVNLSQSILTPEICKALGPGIQLIALTSTFVCGRVAPVIANLARGGCGRGLRFLQLGGNRLTGTLPGGLPGGTSAAGLVPNLDVHADDCDGGVWLEFKKLEWLLLWENALTGGIPEQLGACTRMEHLYLSENRMSGPLPASLCTMAELKGLVLSQNEFTGSIPEAWSSLKALEKLHLCSTVSPRLGPKMSALCHGSDVDFNLI